LTAAPPPAPEPVGVVPRMEISMVKLLVPVMAVIGNVPLVVTPLKVVAPLVLNVESCEKP
jgi:hypothetical protein